MTYNRFLTAFVSAALFMGSSARSAVDPSLQWHTITTEHFNVHYHDGEEWTAEQVARIAEEVHPYITGLYHYDPGRVNFVIKDTEDYANGAAYYYDNKVEIWATNLEFGLRGTTQWLRNVVTHEYTHVVSIQAAMKMPLRIPAIYFQMIGFEDEKRPDVLTGYPNNITSYPFVGAVVPPWFAEGVAQYQTPEKQTDCWDTHRDMILRAAILDDKMLTYEEMGYFGHTSLGNEEVYDHGYGLVRYIAMTYGPDSIDRITQELGRIARLNMDGALKKVTGKKGDQLYRDWQDYLRARYRGQVERVRENPRKGRVLSGEGFMNVYPTFSPDGSRVVLLSNKGEDYATTSLYIVDRDGKNMKLLQTGVSSRPVFSPDGKRILYARHRRINKYGAMQSDIHVYDLEKKKEKRLTRAARAAQPEYSPDGSRIVCVVNGDGTHRIVTMNADGKDPRVIVEGPKGTQFYNPQYSPRGDKILFGVFESGTRDIAVADSDGGNFVYLVKSVNDERDARWLPDGSGIVFSSDRTGIFNVYTMQLGARYYRQLTNVIGGAFAPDVSPSDGSLVYSGYSGSGYHVSILDGGSEPVAEMFDAEYNRRAQGHLDECVALKRKGEPPQVANIGSVRTDAGMQTDLAPDVKLEKHDYESTYTNFQVYPRVVIYDGSPRLGAFLASSEILEKQSFFVGGSYGTNGEFDGFVDFELRHLYPVLFMNFIAVREKFADHVRDLDFENTNIEWDLDLRYDLWAADLGVRLEFEDMYNLTSRHDLSLWYSHSEYRVHIDPTRIVKGDRSPDNAVGWTYYRANDVYLRWYAKMIDRAIDADINPRGGREISLQYMRSNADLFTSGEFEYGFKPDFDTNRFDQFTVDWREYLALPWWRHTLQLRGYGSFIDKKVDDFFYVYLGGMDGIRGYTYYSIGGRKGVIGSATYRFPIWRRIGKQFLHLTFKDVYGGVFYEAANAWNTVFHKSEFKDALGFEVRLNLGSFYVYPTTVNFASARALDEVVFENPIYESSEPIVNEKKWRYYVTVGFTF